MLYVRHWSDEPDPVIKLYLMGVVSGTGSESFGSENLITRQEAAVMLHRLCTALGYSFQSQRRCPLQMRACAPRGPWTVSGPSLRRDHEWSGRRPF